MWQDAKQGFTSAIDSFWGGQCVAEAQCADYVATCSSQGKQPTNHSQDFQQFKEEKEGLRDLL